MRNKKKKKKKLDKLTQILTRYCTSLKSTPLLSSVNNITYEINVIILHKVLKKRIVIDFKALL